MIMVTYIRFVSILRIPIGKYDEALVYYQEAVAGQEGVLGADHPDTKKTRPYNTNRKIIFIFTNAVIVLGTNEMKIVVAF